MATDPNSPHVVVYRRTEGEAQLLVTHLESVGIKAYAPGAGPSTGWPGVPCDYPVVVRRADLERAKQQLAATILRPELNRDRSTRNSNWVVATLVILVVVALLTGLIPTH